MEVYRVKTGSILPLGKQGENLVRQIQFDLSRWIGTFGPGTVQLLHQRRGDETPYPVAVEQDGNLAVWTVNSADTAAAGTGRAELQYYVGDALAKSETWMTKVLAALGPAGETPPEAQQGWVDQVLQAGAAAAEAADRAEEAAVRQPYPNAETGTWWVWNAESGAYVDTGISYGTGDSGGGVTDHEKLTGRDKADQHPMSAITGLEDALAGKQPTGTYLTEETDPTVPDWAKEPTKPGYTASEVGADPSGTASSQVSAHNTGADTHSDIRLLIQGLTERLNALADSDDTTLDQLSEVVAYIKSNRSLIEDITTSKVSVADIIDNLTTNAANKPLSAAQGVALKALIDAITIPTALPNPNALTFTGAVSGSYDGSAPLEVEIPSGGGGLTVTNTAAVGQTVRITAVDETGQPTEWEAVDMASGGVATAGNLLYDIVLEEDASFSITDFDTELSEYIVIIGTVVPDTGIISNVRLFGTIGSDYYLKISSGFAVLSLYYRIIGNVFWMARDVNYRVNTDFANITEPPGSPSSHSNANIRSGTYKFDEKAKGLASYATWPAGTHIWIYGR